MNDLLGLTDKVVLVTGSGQGMGRGIALMFARAGSHAVIADLNGKNAEAVAGEVRALGRQAIAMTADVRKSPDVQRMVDAALQKFGRIDVLVNNVGGLGGRKMQVVSEASDEFWDGVVELNIRTTFLCSRAVSREWIKRKTKGVIINIASISGLRGSLRLAPYGTAKAGVMHLTQTLAMELGPYGIRVNCVAPASIQTPDVMQHMTPERTAQTASVMPLRRIGMPEDIGGVVMLLASDLAGYVTGQTLLADGGLSCTTARPPAPGA